MPVPVPSPSQSYDLLKSIVRLSVSSLPIPTKLEQMLQLLSREFESDRCVLLEPEKIIPDGFLHRLALGKKPVWVEEESSFQKGNVLPEEDFLCPPFVCIPLYRENSLRGILYLGFPKQYRFSPSQTDLLLLVAEVIEKAIQNEEASETVQKHEKSLKELSTLWELNKALLTTVNLERILHLTLTAITIGEGLKFNRAMLFLVSEKGRVLEGAMAVGPDNAEEASRVWASLSPGKEALSDRITQFDPESHSNLNAVVKQIRISLEQEQCILSRTVLEARSFNMQLPQSKEGWLRTRCERGCQLGSEVGCYVGEHLSRDPSVYSFATVPLMGKGKVIGVVLVDNLYNRNPITEEDIHFLSMFTSQAGLAIENATLYRNLEEVHQELKETQTFLVHLEKMVALGEMSTTLAHEIKNPLTSIGGFARRLDRVFPEGSQEKKYSQTIIKEVTRLEKILKDLLSYTRDESLVLTELDLRDVLEESLSVGTEEIHSGAIRLVKEYAEEIPPIKGDSHQLKQGFFNLINNSCQAMNGSGTLYLRIFPYSRDGSPWVRLEVEDTGKGIDPENLHNIFNPFYSTRESSLGLGLPILHRIIASHRGQIEVDNRPGVGVKFIVVLPAAGTTLSRRVSLRTGGTDEENFSRG